MKKIGYWLIAIVITLVLSIYQRMTGPTNPKRVTVELNEKNYKLKLPRSGVQEDEIVILKGIPSNTNAQIHYHRYPTSDEYTTIDFSWKDDKCKATLPVQPVGGKLQYYITVEGKDYPVDEPLIIRFRNDVPASILIPHRPTCGFRTLVDRISFWNRPYRQQDTPILSVFCCSYCYFEVEIQ